MWVIFYLFVFLATAFVTYCRFIKCYYTYWKKRHVPHPPVSAVFGNIKDAIFLKRSLAQIYDAIYKSYPSLSYVGVYKLRQQGILLRDPELIKEVLIRSFSSFHDNDFSVDEKADPLLLNPFTLRGERWKIAKHQISPMFTGKRIKSMFTVKERVCKKLVKYLQDTDPGKNGFEAKELASKYSADVIANCAFGVETNSFEESHPEFLKMVQELVTPSFFSILVTIINSIFSPLANVLKVKAIPNKLENYFRGIISQTLEYRNNNNLQRNDFLGYMNELKSKQKFTNDDITANSLAILFDGYAIASTALSFALYELGANLHVQNKLLTEITDVIEKHGKVCYDTIQEMPYLDKVLNECLRKNTAVPYFGKLCTEQLKFPAPHEHGPEVTIEPGTFIAIPISSIHNDPKYFPDPEKFDPERFSEESRETRPKCTFLPFGDGPRICLGQRFGVAQLKTVIVQLILNFEITVNQKTSFPLQIDPKSHFLAPKGGIWLDFITRQGRDSNNCM